MNERIRELALQAGAVNVWEWATDDVLDTKNMDAEKFAELIVLKCLDIVANADMTGSWITHPKDVLYVACDQVKKHFGVEE